jgi:ribonuclease HI
MAFEWLSANAKRMAIEKVDILMDSELIVKQMKGEYKIKDETLKTLAMRVKEHQQSIPCDVMFAHVRRAENASADKLVNAAMDEELTHVSSTGN